MRWTAVVSLSKVPRDSYDNAAAALMDVNGRQLHLNVTATVLVTVDSIDGFLFQFVSCLRLIRKRNK